MDFIKSLYQETALLFNDNETKIQVARDENNNDLSMVRIIHLPTSTTIEVDDFDSQTENAIVARLKLHLLLKEKNISTN